LRPNCNKARAAFETWNVEEGTAGVGKVAFADQLAE